MRWLICLGAAVTIVATSMAPGSAAHAVAQAPGGGVGPMTSSTSSPPCHYFLNTSPTTNGGVTTALHTNAMWWCGVDVDGWGSVQLTDLSIPPGWSVGSQSGGTTGPSGSVALDYFHPKTGHTYQATFLLIFSKWDPAWRSEGGCSQDNGVSIQQYVCVFQQTYVVQQAPPIGPAPAHTPVHRSFAITTTDGHSCEADLDIASAGPGQLAFRGSTPPSSCNAAGAFSASPVAWGRTFAYVDRSETGAPATSGSEQCPSTCTDASAGTLPATGSYTVTYYVAFETAAPAATLPGQCTQAERTLVYCELTGSVTS